jgi:hypothetical protein
LFWSSRSCRGQDEPNEGLFYTAALNWGALSYCIPVREQTEYRHRANLATVTSGTSAGGGRRTRDTNAMASLLRTGAVRARDALMQRARVFGVRARTFAPPLHSREAFVSQPRVCSHWQTVRDRVFWSSDPHLLYPRSPRPIADHSPSTPPRLFPTHRPAAPGA